MLLKEHKKTTKLGSVAKPSAAYMAARQPGTIVFLSPSQSFSFYEIHKTGPFPKNCHSARQKIYMTASDSAGLLVEKDARFTSESLRRLNGGGLRGDRMMDMIEQASKGQAKGQSLWDDKCGSRPAGLGSPATMPALFPTCNILARYFDPS